MAATAVQTGGSGAERPTVSLVVSPRRLLGSLTAAIVALVLADVAFAVLRFGFGHDHVFGLAEWFELDRERSVPTWFATAQLALAAALLGYIASDVAGRASWRAALPWMMLAAGFAYLSLDEATEIHVLFPRLAGDITKPPFAFGWTSTAVVIVAAVAAGFARFLLRLPPATRRAFLVSGAVFVAGAVGMEMVGGWVILEHGQRRLWEAATTIEELLELAGVRLFVGALLAHIAAEPADVPEPPPVRAPRAAGVAAAAVERRPSASSTGR